MSRVREFFVQEGTECLDVIRVELERNEVVPGVIHAAFRRFRGSAQMARFGDLARTAGTLESLLKPLARGREPWTEEWARRANGALRQLTAGIEAVREGQIAPDEEPEHDEETMDHESPQPDDVVAAESLEYEPDDALGRAAELKEPLEEAILSGEPAGGILDELFDLIRLAAR